MSNELVSRPTPAAFALPPMNRARFRIHSVACPKCGRVFWFTLFSERSSEEVAQATRDNEQRLRDEPCERHAAVAGAAV